ncbi:hypothetical protein J2847_000449 [Azospirillum agricola]|uniref:hypothetical protein n=1 Tax=Azospirillum agricola TaxID=1720247 RepID=UPI001AE346A5|nr:hypothetical protein [Azospirillum agricola]MBP2227182.1 hypothetical protein [Azospirillum agricola]
MKPESFIFVMTLLISSQSIAQNSPSKEETENFISNMWFPFNQESKLYFDNCTMIEKHQMSNSNEVDNDKSVYSIYFPLNELDIYAQLSLPGSESLKFFCNNGAKCIKKRYILVWKDKSKQKERGEDETSYEDSTSRANWKSRIDFGRAEKAINHLQKICKGDKKMLFE